MANFETKIKKEWVDKQISKFEKISPKYTRYAQTLKIILEEAARKYDPLSIVQTRPKSIASFAEKIVRKWSKYRDPVNQITDLCGGRVIVHTQAQTKKISKFIEENFVIDWDNSIDVEQRLKPTEFGYRSIHYIVQFKPDWFPTADFEIDIPKSIIGLKAEIQVRTILEHAWADFQHEWLYKNEFEMPPKLLREMIGIAARLEAADNSFSRIQEGIKNYYTSYGSYMNKDQMLEEMEKLEITLKYDPQNLNLVREIGKLAIVLEDWDKAITKMSKLKNSDDPKTIRNLGTALCKKYSKDRKNRNFEKGQKLLLKAGSPPFNDSDALASLAGTWKGIDEEKAREYYRQAYELDPTDSYPLGNYLESEIVKQKNLSIIGLMHPIIDSAIQRCRDCIAVGVNLPWAYYDIGKLKLLLGEPYDSIAAYAKAIEVSTASFMVDTSMNSLRRLSILKNEFEGYDWIEGLFLTGLAAKFNHESAISEINKKVLSERIDNRSPIVIMVGGSNNNAEQKMDQYREVILSAFHGFEGTVISGGTTFGISKITGDLKSEYGNSICAIGYAPKKSSLKVERNPKRYNEINKTKGNEFSPLEAIQYWFDLISSDIDPADVSVLVVGGGQISMAECQIALTLGAKVGVIEESGGETAKLFSDTDWSASVNLIQIPADAIIIKSFINSGISKMDESMREIIAKEIHKQYRETKMKQPEKSDPSAADWKKLPENLKESNRLQADQIFEKLKLVGCDVRKVEDRDVALMKFSKNEIEQMAEMEHARWVIERLSDGWEPAETKDVSKKLSPYLVGWEYLSEDIKDYDRDTVKKIPQYLSEVGLEVYRISNKK